MMRDRTKSGLTCLFNLLLKKVIWESEIKRNGMIYHQTRQGLAYADDIVAEKTNLKKHRLELRKYHC